jgi:hypothetical protein
MKMRTLTVICAAATVLALAGFAHATTVQYTVSAWTNQYPGPTTPPAGSPWGTDGYPGDTVALATYTGTLDLTLGTCEKKINMLNWTVDYTYAGTETDWNDWSEISFDINAPRSMTIGTAGGSISQGGLLECNWSDDYLALSDGSTTSFTVNGYHVDVTPLGVARTGSGYGTWGGTNPWPQAPRDVMARFDITPEPATMALLALGGIGMLVRRKRSK